MRNRGIKTAVVSAAVMIFALVPATQAFACHGGYGYSYDHYGYGYYPPTTPQRYAPVPQSYTPTTSTNNFDPTIYDVQVVLFEKGYYEGELDGLIGEQTKTALLSFQEDNDIPQTDNANAVTLKADTVTLEALGL